MPYSVCCVGGCCCCLPCVCNVCVCSLCCRVFVPSAPPHPWESVTGVPSSAAAVETGLKGWRRAGGVFSLPSGCCGPACILSMKSALDHQPLAVALFPRKKPKNVGANYHINMTINKADHTHPALKTSFQHGAGRGEFTAHFTFLYLITSGTNTPISVELQLVCHQISLFYRGVFSRILRRKICRFVDNFSN